MKLRWNLSKIWSQELQLPLNTYKPCLVYSTQLTRTCSFAPMRVTKLLAVTSSSSCHQPFSIVWPVAPRGCISGYGLSGKNDHPWPPLHALKDCNISSLTPCIIRGMTRRVKSYTVSVFYVISQICLKTQ
jgi:hypothetical protein